MLDLLSRVFTPRPTEAAVSFVVYVVVIKFIAPVTFRRKLPHRLTYIRLLYYVIQVLLNAWLILQFYLVGGFNFFLQYCSQAGEITRVVLLGFYISKWINLFSTLLLALERRFNEILFANLIIEGIAMQSAWSFYALAEISYIPVFVVADVITHFLVHCTNILTMKCPKVNRNLLVTIRFLQGSFLVIHSVEIWVWNSCELSTDYLILIPLNTLMILISMYSTPREHHQQKTTKKFDGHASSVIDFDYGYEPVSTTNDSFFKMGRDSIDTRKRSGVNKLQAQV